MTALSFTFPSWSWFAILLFNISALNFEELIGPP